MDRSLWTSHFAADALPTWPCPDCGKGHVTLVPKTLIHKETAESVRAKESLDWDPDWIQYVFVCWGECSHSTCKQPFTVTGKGGVSPYYHEDHGEDWGDYFKPLACYPMPCIISIPEKSPYEVTEPLMAAFSLFWSNPESCAGRIRVSLEALMNHLGVQKKQENNKGKLSDLTLHGRIEKYALVNPIEGAQLLAMKWLGNAGSHDGGAVSHADLLDAFEIMEHALLEIIDERSKRVAALANKLTKKHSN